MIRGVRVRDGVYPPSEDTFLLLDHLPGGNGLAIDLGTGSGIVALELAGRGWSVLATDLSGEAVENALENAEEAGLREMLEFVRADLLQFLREGVRIDLIVFNAPYLPSREPVKDIYTYSWHGGAEGGQVIKRMIEAIEDRRLEVGEILLIHSTLSPMEECISKLKRMGYKVEIVDERPNFFHRIILLRATKFYYPKTKVLKKEEV